MSDPALEANVRFRNSALASVGSDLWTMVDLVTSVRGTRTGQNRPYGLSRPMERSSRASTLPIVRPGEGKDRRFPSCLALPSTH
jgi:hypothetical protein